MGKQSSRIYFQGKDHKDICFNNRYSSAMMLRNEIVWKKIYQFDGIFSFSPTSFYDSFSNYLEKKTYKLYDISGKTNNDHSFFFIKNKLVSCYTLFSDNSLVISCSDDMAIFKEVYKRKMGNLQYADASHATAINDDIVCVWVNSKKTINGKTENDLTFILHSFLQDKNVEYTINNAKVYTVLNNEIGNHEGKIILVLVTGDKKYKYLLLDMEGYLLTECLVDKSGTDKRSPFMYYNNKFYYAKRTAKKDENNKDKYIYEVKSFDTNNEEYTVCTFKITSKPYDTYGDHAAWGIRNFTSRVNDKTYIIHDRIIKFSEDRNSATVEEFNGVNFYIDKYKNQKKIGKFNFVIDTNLKTNLYTCPFVIINNKLDRNCMVFHLTENTNDNEFYYVLIRDLFESSNNVAIFDDKFPGGG